MSICSFAAARSASTIGPIAYRRSGENFLGEGGQGKAHSEMIAQAIDAEITQVIGGCYDQALALLKKHNRFLHQFAEALLLHETMDAEEVDIVYRRYLKQREIERLFTDNGGQDDSEIFAQQTEVHP